MHKRHDEALTDFRRKYEGKVAPVVKHHGDAWGSVGNVPRIINIGSR